jgi:D-xylose 1-dehydrogenase (NADP+, D-xylono-1,5-lactone-forming)
VTIRWGLLSTARINKLVLEGARESDCVEVIAVASRERARAEAYARKNLIERAYDGYEALIADTEVDAVYISLPNALHVEWTLRALEAGKHVLTEKPFSRRAAEVEAAFDVADRYELVLSEGFMWRHHPQTRALEDLLAGNAIGRLRLVRAAFSFPLATVHGPDDARFDPQLAGGALMDVGCYCVNAIRAFGGEPVEVRAHQVVGETGVDVVFAASLRLSNNVLAHFDCGFVVPFRDELELVGEDASLFVDDPFHVHVPGDRAATWVWNRAARGASRKLVSPGTRERERRDPRPGAAAARSRRRGRSGPRHRGSLRRSGCRSAAHVGIESRGPMLKSSMQGRSPA